MDKCVMGAGRLVKAGKTMTRQTWFIGSGRTLRVYSGVITLQKGREEAIIYTGRVTDSLVLFLVRLALGAIPERRG